MFKCTILLSVICTDGLHKIRLNYSEDSADGGKLNEDELIDFSEEQDNQVKYSAVLFRKCKILCSVLNGQYIYCKCLLSKARYLYKCQIQNTDYFTKKKKNYKLADNKIVYSLFKLSGNCCTDPTFNAVSLVHSDSIT